MPPEAPAGGDTAKTIEALIGKTLDARYRIDGVLGKGGVGVVYAAQHLRLNQPVAVKVLLDRYFSLKEIRVRFEREARVLSTLRHPQIVSVSDYGLVDGMAYLVMEQLEGRTLADCIDDDGPMDPAVALRVARSILRGVAYAHQQGVVHRDLKAANVFLVALPDDPFHVKILDFGLAKLFDHEGDADEPTLTRAGAILGTPAYMPPEQASGYSVDKRADVYSTGVLLFEMLTGRYPFEAETRAEMLRAHMLTAPPDPEEVRPELRLSPELKAFLDKSLAKSRGDRFKDAQDMLDALDALPPGSARVAGLFESVPGLQEAAKPTVGQEEPSTMRTVPLLPDDDARTVEAQLPADLSAGAKRQIASLETERPPSARRLVQRPLVVGTVVAVVGFVAAWFITISLSDQSETPMRAQSLNDAANQATSPDRPDASSEGGSRAPDAETPSDAQPGGDAEPEVIGDSLRGPQPPAYDPFVKVLPASMRQYHLAVRKGERLSRPQIRRLMALQTERPEDPRPSLIAAHAFVDMRWYSDAIERYARAYQIDMGSRGDARMMRDLIRLAGLESVQDEAADLVLRVFGTDARLPLQRAIAEATSVDERERLESLLMRIGL